MRITWVRLSTVGMVAVGVALASPSLASIDKCQKAVAGVGNLYASELLHLPGGI